MFFRGLPGGLRVWKNLSARFWADWDRWPLWLPVAMGCGIALYFSLDREPDWYGALIGFALAGGMVAMGWRRGAFLPLAAGGLGLAVASGFMAAQTRTQMVAAPVLERPTGAVWVTGRVEEVDLRAGGGQRIVLGQLSANLGDEPVPERVRLTVKTDMALPVGARIGMRASLMPPNQPVLPGAFDFARYAWFLELGAVGSGLSEPRILAPAAEDKDGSWLNGLWLNSLRDQITRRIAIHLPGATGGVAAALITGEVGGIPRDVLDDYRDSGLAHLLSISGLHMSLVAGLVFFVIRGGLALFPGIALRHPIKKWAAAVALAATFFYMMLAGAPVPAQRSFLMTGIVLAAVLVDRVALSMRMVAWAAALIMLFFPEAVIGPSFQMSFAAVAALIAAYEWATPRMARWKAANPGLVASSVHYLGGVVFSTLVAGSATAIYGLYHFNRFALWSVAANMAAVPLTGFLVMPFAVLALLLMPFGLEFLALVPMGWGVDACNWVARQVASWPWAALSTPVLPLWGLVAFTLGFCWLLIWRGSWRLWGIAPMILGLCTLMFHRPPDVLVDGRGYSFGVRMGDGGLAINRGGRIVRESWLRRAGPGHDGPWPKQGSSADGVLSCDRSACLYRIHGRVAGLIHTEDGITTACTQAWVVVSAVPLRRRCHGPALVVDRFDLWRHGGHLLWLDGPAPRMETMTAWQGNRPWSYQPRSRRQTPLPAQDDPDVIGAETGTEKDDDDGGNGP